VLGCQREKKRRTKLEGEEEKRRTKLEYL